jgi:predicted DNA-binding WGR domain protein
MRRFECQEGTANKFWEVEVDGTELTVQYGPIGTTGKTQTKSFASADEARAEAEKLVSRKLRKGYVEVAGAAGSIPKRVKLAMPAGPMTEDVFWALIRVLDWKRTGDDAAVLRPAVTALSLMCVEDIYAFDDLLAAKLYALDTREIARGTYRGQIDPDDGDQYLSADDFLYARCVIVANGKAFFEKALANPMEVPQGMEFEALITLASSAYEKKVGQEYGHVTPLSWETFSNTDGWRSSATTRPGRYTSALVPPLNRRPS